MTTPMTDRLLTAREVSDLLGVSTETVLRWTRAGKLPAVKLPSGAVRFRQDELDAWTVERATLRRGDVTQPAERRSAAIVDIVTQSEDEE